MLRVVPLVVLLVVLSTVSGAFAAGGKPNADPTILGSWALEVSTTTTAQTFPGLITFTSEGGLIADEPPAPGETSGHGNWVRRGRGEVAYTFYGLYSAPDGSYAGKLKVVGTFRYDDGTASWSGPFKIVIFDASGQTTLEDTGTMRATRIEVEDLN